MDSAVAAHMITQNSNENRYHLDTVHHSGFLTDYTLAETGRETVGEKMISDADTVDVDCEYEGTTSNIYLKNGTVGNIGDSSCWRPELPSAALLDYLRTIAHRRHQQEIRKNYLEEDDNVKENLSDSLSSSFSASAIVAVGIIVEELSREMMVSWGSRTAKTKMTQANEGHCNSDGDLNDASSGGSKRNENKRRKRTDVGTGPLGLLSKRTLKIEARLQLQGALFRLPSTSSESFGDEKISFVTPALLRNRLEVSCHYNHC
jgi:hypothetical protein